MPYPGVDVYCGKLQRPWYMDEEVVLVDAKAGTDISAHNSISQDWFLLLEDRFGSISVS